MTLRSRGFLAGASIVASLMIGTFGAVANNSVVKAVAKPEQWAVAGHDYANTRFSQLKQINSENASKLSLVYSFSLASLRSNESVADHRRQNTVCHDILGTEIRLCAGRRNRRAQMDL